jgi:hypothetical protein
MDESCLDLKTIFGLAAGWPGWVNLSIKLGAGAGAGSGLGAEEGRRAEWRAVSTSWVQWMQTGPFCRSAARSRGARRSSWSCWWLEAMCRMTSGMSKLLRRQRASTVSCGLKPATGAAADVEAAEQGALRAGRDFQDALHGGLRSDGIVHEPKNFWIFSSTSIRRSTSFSVL